MSKTKLPTVPRHSKRRRFKLPMLQTAIFTDGKFSHIDKQPDPRVLLCTIFNRDYGKFGMSAQPVTEGGAK